MAVCDLPYLKKLTTLPTIERDRLTDTHYSIGKALKAIPDPSGTDPLFYTRDGYVRLSTRLPQTYAEQLQAIDQLNTRFGGTVDRPVVFKTELQESYDPGDGDIQVQTISVVGIDVRPLINPQYLTVADLAAEDSNLTSLGLDELETVSQTDLARNLKSFSLQADPNQEYNYVSQVHNKLFTEAAKDLRTKLITYLRLLEKGAVKKPADEIRLTELKAQIKALDDTEAMGTVEAISEFVVQSAGWLDAVYDNFFVGPDSVVTKQRELDLNINRQGELLADQEREDKIREVAQELHKSKHYLYLFNSLKDFSNGLTKAGFIEKPDQVVERGPGFTKDLNDYLDQIGTTPGRREVVNTFLQSPHFTMQGLRIVLTEQISKSDRSIPAEEIAKGIDTLFKHLQTTYPAKSTESVLRLALGKAYTLQSNLADHHKQLVKSWIWPRIKAKQAGYEGKYKLTEDQVIPLLESASEDEGIFTYALDAPIQSQDPITAIIANIVSDSIYTAAAETRVDVGYLSAERDLLALEKTMTTQQIRDYHQDMVHDVVLRLEGQEESIAGPDWKGPVLELTNFWGETVKLKGYTKKGYLEEYNTSLQEANKLYFYKTLPGQTQQLWDMIPKLADGTIDSDGKTPPSELLKYLIDNSTNPYYKAVLDRLFYYSRQYGWLLKKGVINPAEPFRLRKLIKSAMTREFMTRHYQAVSDTKKEELYQKHGVTGEINKVTAQINPWIRKNSSSSRLAGDPELKEKALTNPKNKSWLDNLVSYKANNTTYIYVRKIVSGQEQYEWVDVSKPNFLNGVTHLYYNKYQLTKSSELYSINNNSFGQQSRVKWENLHQNPTKLRYFQALYGLYDSANQDKLTRVALKHGVLPQVEQLDNIDLGQEGWWDRLWSWVSNHTFVKGIRDGYNWITGTETEEEKHHGQTTYLNNEPVKGVRARFTSEIPDDQVEMDLFRSTLMYKAGANHYRALRNIDPQVQAVKTLIGGDKSLGLDERQAITDSYDQKVLDKVIHREEKKRANRLNKKLTGFLDDVIYGDSIYAAQFKLGNKTIDLANLGRKLSGATAVANLAWNISSMAGNIGVGFLANYSESVKGKYYQPEDWRAAWGNYWQNAPGLIRDLTETNPAKWSKLTQAAYLTDAIQGEIMTDQGNISRTGTTEKFMSRALFFTQSGAEHWIQTISMESQMRGFKLASGVSIWDDLVHTPGETAYFKTATAEEQRQFQQQLHSVNKQLHGHYSQFDKALIQRYWLGQLAMMFKKYIYSSIRYRFGGLRYDWEAGDETEGHLRAYWSKLHGEIKQEKNKLLKAAMWGNGLLIKPTLGAVDQLTGGLISKNSTGASQFLYGDETEQRNSAARQTAFDVLWYTLMVFMAGFIHGLDDDDDPNGVVLGNLEAFARRMGGDLGMFLPGYGAYGVKNAFTTYDKSWQLVKSPLAQLRTYDNTVSLLSHLVGFENTPEGIDFSINDRYERSGPGYEMGDLKLDRLLQKSLFGPWYQITKFMNPDIGLQYQNLARRNSN